MAEFDSVAAQGAENTTTPSVAEPANVFGFAPEDDAPAQGGQVFGFAPEGTPDGGRETTGEQAPEQPAQRDDAGPADDRKTNAFAAQRRQYRKELDELRASPAMGIGNQLIRDVMQQDGCTREEAVERINQRFVAAYAKREGIGEGAARILYNMQEPAEEPPAPAGQQRTGGTPEQQAAAIVDELMAVQLPEGFDMDAAMNDKAFQTLLVDYGAKAAVRIYAAEQKASRAPQQVADMLRARQSVPAPTRPSQSVNAEPNYTQMSTDDFWKVKERYKKNLNL